MVTYRTAVRATHELKKALVAATKTLYAADDTVLVTFGHPGPQVSNYDNAVVFSDIEDEQTPATISTNRTREVEARITCTVSCVRPGGFEAESTAAEAAVSILEDIEDYLRDTDPTLGGRARRIDVGTHRHESLTDPSLVDGRIVEYTTVIRAWVRITS